MKKLIYFTILGGLALTLNSCYSGYVSEEPVYVESYRPARQSSTQIWIEGNWVWSSREQRYTHDRGRWVEPRRGHHFKNGYWKKNKRGSHWVPYRHERD